MTATREQLLETAQALIASYELWTLDGILQYRSPDCIQHSLPTSRKQPDRNNDEYAKFFATRLPVYRNFRTSVDQDRMFVDVQERKVFLHVRSKANTVAGPYSNEYDFVMKMTQSGDKVQEIWEFIDTAYADKFTHLVEGEPPS